MEWQPVLAITKGPLYHDLRGDELCPVAYGKAVPRDLCRTSAMRALAVAAHVRGRAVLVDEAAVFVHTGLWTINPAVLRQVPTAPLPGQSTRWTTDRRLLKDDQVIFLGGVPVTTPARTAADLLFADDERGIAATIALYRAGLEPSELQELLGERFRGFPTDRISRLAEHLAVTAKAGPVNP